MTQPALSMAFWSVRPDIVRDNLRRFTAETGIAVTPFEVAGDYAEEIERLFAEGRPPDVFYAQRGEASRWIATGLVEPLDRFPETAAIMAEMSDLVAASSRDAAGRTIGLTYYNAGPFCLFRNEAALAAIGRDLPSVGEDWPARWETVIEDAARLKARGLAEHPLLMRWHDTPTGLTWAFLAECFSEGERLVDDAGRAAFDDDGPVAAILGRWQRIMRDGLVPDGILDWPDDAFDRAWMTGRHAYFMTMDYLAATYTDTAGSAVADHLEVNPRLPGATGDTLLLGHALLCLSRRQRDAAATEAAWALLRYLGHRDASGDLAVHRRWVRALDLWVPYPEIYRDPEMIAVMRARHRTADPDASLARRLAGRNRVLIPGIVAATGYLDWCRAFRRVVRADLRAGGRDPVAVARTLRREWERIGEAAAA